MKRSNFKFMIIGAGRGGTSLLTALLDYHSEMVAISEYASTEILMGRGFECDNSEIIPQRILSFKQKCEIKAQQNPAKIWGNKITTEQLRGLEDHNRYNANIDILDVFFNQYFSDHKIIFILRDGRSCVSSKVKRTGQPMKKACERWKYSVEVYQYLKARKKNSLCIKFEDLLYNPENVLTGICDFLEVNFEKNMFKGVSNDLLLPEYRNTGFVTEKAKAVNLPDKYLKIIERELIDCDYL